MPPTPQDAAGTAPVLSLGSAVGLRLDTSDWEPFVIYAYNLQQKGGTISGSFSIRQPTDDDELEGCAKMFRGAHFALNIDGDAVHCKVTSVNTRVGTEKTSGTLGLSERDSQLELELNDAQGGAIE